MGSHVRGEKNSHIKGMNINTGTSACNNFHECLNLKIQINNNILRNIEERSAPKIRDDAFVRRAVAIATESKPFVGHKSQPLLCQWSGYSWRRMNVPEIMHGTVLFLVKYSNIIFVFC